MAWLVGSHLLFVLAHSLGGKVTCQSSLQPFAGNLNPPWDLQPTPYPQSLVQPGFMSYSGGVEVGTHIPQSWTTPSLSDLH